MILGPYFDKKKSKEGYSETNQVSFIIYILLEPLTPYSKYTEKLGSFIFIAYNSFSLAFDRLQDCEIKLIRVPDCLAGSTELYSSGVNY